MSLDDAIDFAEDNLPYDFEVRLVVTKDYVMVQLWRGDTRIELSNIARPLKQQIKDAVEIAKEKVR